MGEIHESFPPEGTPQAAHLGSQSDVPLPPEKPRFRESTMLENIGDILTGNRSGPIANKRYNDYGQPYKSRGPNQDRMYYNGD